MEKKIRKTVIDGQEAIKVYGKAVNCGHCYTRKDVVYMHGVEYQFIYKWTDDPCNAQLVDTKIIEGVNIGYESLLYKRDSEVISMFIDGDYDGIKKEVYRLAMAGRYDSIRYIYHDMSDYASSREMSYTEYKNCMSLIKLMYNILNK